MPRKLSNPEWVQFQNDVNVEGLGLPPWGGVVEWGNQLVLVFICPDPSSWLCRSFGLSCPALNPTALCQPGEIMISDVTDRRELLTNIPRTYDVNSGNWVYHVPEQTMARLYEVSRSAMETTGKIIQTIATEAGKAAGALTAPLAENIALPLALGVALYLVLKR